MKINQIIKEKRKELSLTQEQLAVLLGVSTPAVSKWETGAAYPDITLLPALARLLKTDLNTLLSFNEDLTDEEITAFVNETDKAVKNKGYEAAFNMATEKLNEYPACDRLTYSVIMYLEGALFLYGISDADSYRKAFEAYYKRLSASEIPEIRDNAVNMLISYARNKEEFDRAEALINTLPFSSVDREEQLAILYQKQKRHSEAEKIWEHRIIKGASEIQLAIMNMLEIALYKSDFEYARFLADTYEAVIRQFCFPAWMAYSAHLQLSVAQKDKDVSLSVLEKMLPAMKEEWQPYDCPLYRNQKKGDFSAMSDRLLDTIIEELSCKDEYEFLRDSPDFERLLLQLKGR